MKEKNEKQIEEMKKQTISVEIEMNNITRMDAANVVATYFGTRQWYAARDYSYDACTCKDRKYRVWKFQKDVSIAGFDSEKCEMVAEVTPSDIKNNHLSITERYL